MIFERSLLENNADDELSTSILLEIVLTDLALLTKDVEFIEPLAREELIASTDRRLDKLSWVAIAVRLLVRYSTELGGEVTCRVGVTLIVVTVIGVVWITVEIGKIETPSLVETFATDTLGLRSGEEVMLRFILLPEVVTIVCGRLGVNASEKRIVVSRDVTDGDPSTTKVCVSSGRDKFVVTPEV